MQIETGMLNALCQLDWAEGAQTPGYVCEGFPEEKSV